MFSCRFYQRRISSFVISSVVLDFFQTCYKRKSFLLQKEKLSFTRGKVFCYKRKSFLLQEEKFSITRGKAFLYKRKRFFLQEEKLSFTRGKALAARQRRLSLQLLVTIVFPTSLSSPPFVIFWRTSFYIFSLLPP